MNMSHPMWVRGLKRFGALYALCASRSHPMWVRGLKLHEHFRKKQQRNVAPYVGAWIETERSIATIASGLVAPYVGAWIETTMKTGKPQRWKSHPMWVRGLKLYLVFIVLFTGKSHPMWVRGLKRNTLLIEEHTNRSHPMWVRGLKHISLFSLP